jgi:hypothetical protein
MGKRICKGDQTLFGVHREYLHFVKINNFLRRGVFSPTPNPKLEDHSLSAVRDGRTTESIENRIFIVLSQQLIVMYKKYLETEAVNVLVVT